jgi:hypothetical protein
VRLVLELALAISLGLWAPGAAPGQISDEEYAVYSDLLGQLEFGRPHNINDSEYVYCVRSETDTAEEFRSTLSYNFRESYPVAADSFQAVNNTPGQLVGERFSIEVRVIDKSQFPPYRIRPTPPADMSSTTLLARIGAVQDRWNEFRHEHPDCSSILTLSRVGFSADGRHALVLVASEGGFMSGRGGGYLLERGPSGWLIAHRGVQWIE